MMDPIQSISQDFDGSGLIVQMAEGYKELLSEVRETRPALMIVWDDDNLDRTANKFNQQRQSSDSQEQLRPPSWMRLEEEEMSYHPELIKQKILSHILQTTVGFSGDGVGSVFARCLLLVPNSIDAYTNLLLTLSSIGYDPFFKAKAACPIGNLWKLGDNNDTSRAVRRPLACPAEGVPVFQ